MKLKLLVCLALLSAGPASFAFPEDIDVRTASVDLYDSLTGEKPHIIHVTIDDCDGHTGETATAVTSYRVKCLLIYTTDDQTTSKLLKQFPVGSIFETYFVNVATEH